MRATQVTETMMPQRTGSQGKRGEEIDGGGRGKVKPVKLLEALGVTMPRASTK